ncbi:MAG: hypothetical protein Q7U34_16045 [Anaerolineales bacterium]|nr:hypothetical protein [Anaerolineales bacterium]MDP3186011.1 hypothetical protein [Anaerolineales bacterium]
METVTISQINEQLRKLSIEKLSVVYDFITFLSERETSLKTLRESGKFYTIDTMLASEAVLRRDWDTPEEDEAWANL